MQTVILAGGLGTRMAEETDRIPKPMVTIGDHPILWHIMRYYAGFGHDDFVIPVGYRGDVIKRWVDGLHWAGASVRFDTAKGTSSRLSGEPTQEWQVTVLETGLSTQTSGRIRMALEVATDARVFLTYGDGLADVDLDALIEFHQSHGRLATVTAVRPPRTLRPP